MKESPRPSSVISSLVGLVHDAYVRLHHRPPADNTGRTIDDLDQVQLDEDSLQLGYDDRGVRGVRLTATALRPPPQDAIARPEMDGRDEARRRNIQVSLDPHSLMQGH